MLSALYLSTLALAAGAAAQYTATDVAAVHAAKATALTSSPTSHVKGKAFDRYVVILLENTDYDLASTDRALRIIGQATSILC